MPWETVSMRQVHIPAFIVIYFSARAILFLTCFYSSLSYHWLSWVGFPYLLVFSWLTLPSDRSWDWCAMIAS